MLLGMQGHETDVAFNGREALEHVESFRPDLVLLDLGLPQIDGYEVATRIRAMPKFRHIRIVALSGYGRPEDRQRTKSGGFDAHLVKPIDMALLERTLASG